MLIITIIFIIITIGLGFLTRHLSEKNQTDAVGIELYPLLGTLMFAIMSVSLIIVEIVNHL